MRSWKQVSFTLIFALVALAVGDNPHPCQLSNCQQGIVSNCSRVKIQILTAYPVSYWPEKPTLPPNHLFSMFYDRSASENRCLSLSLDVRPYGEDHRKVDFQLRVAHRASRFFYDVLIWQYTSDMESSARCIQARRNSICEVGKTEQFRVTIVIDNVSFLLEDHSPLVPKGTRILFRKLEVAHSTDGDECTRDDHGHFWKTLKQQKLCQAGKIDRRRALAIRQEALAYKITYGAILIVLLFLLLSHHMVYKFIDSGTVVATAAGGPRCGVSPELGAKKMPPSELVTPTVVVHLIADQAINENGIEVIAL